MGGILGILLVAFIILKAVGLIAWSWWLVLLPLWIWIVLVFVFLFLGTLLTAMGLNIGRDKDRFK